MGQLIHPARLVAAGLVCASIAGCGGGDSSVDTGASASHGRAGDALVARFCAYDTTSHSAIIGCFESTSPFQVAGLTTNAARYARGEIGCKPDSGPFCR